MTGKGPPTELTKIEAASFHEERLLFLLIRLRNPQAHMVYGAICSAPEIASRWVSHLKRL